LRDQTVVPILLERLQAETNGHLQLAYASALGQLRVAEAIPLLLDLLRQREEQLTRMELALAVARIMGHEHTFLQLLQQVNKDAATAISQALFAWKKQLNRSRNEAAELLTAIYACVEMLGREQLAEGIELFRCLIDLLPQEQLPAYSCTILRHCLEGLMGHGSNRMEYVVLTLHAISGEWTRDDPVDRARNP